MLECLGSSAVQRTPSTRRMGTDTDEARAGYVLSRFRPLDNDSVHLRNTDLSWTRAPETIKIIPGYEHDQWARIWDLAMLTFDVSLRARVLSGSVLKRFQTGREKSLVEPKITESSINHHTSLPDEHVACFDYLYYTSASIVRTRHCLKLGYTRD